MKSIDSNNTLTVLIVEDDLILNLLYKSFFEMLGYKTQGEIVSGKNAVEVAHRIEPDLILMDILLEGNMDGIETMEEIRNFSDVPVIYITDNSDPYHIIRAKETNYIDYLVKPIEFTDIKESIDRNFTN